MNILMVSWVAGYLPHPQYQALMCSSGSKGYSAFRRSLEPGYPEHTILLTNVDIRDMQPPQEQEEDEEETQISTALSSPAREVSITISNPAVTTNTSVVTNKQQPSSQPGEPSSEVISSSPSDISATTTPTPLSVIIRVKMPNPSDGFQIVSSYPPWETIRDQLHTHHIQVISNVSTLPVFFLTKCPTLKTIDLSGLSNVCELPYYFLSECINLTSVDFSVLGGGGRWSGGSKSCGGSGAVSSSCLSSSFSSSPSLPSGLLSGCSKLTSITFSGGGPTSNNMRGLPQSIFDECASLTRIVNPPSAAPPPSGWVAEVEGSEQSCCWVKDPIKV